jgi:hypothetical protein
VFKLEYLRKKQDMIVLGLLLILGVFMGFYPDILKKTLIIRESTSLKEKIETLEGEDLEDAKKELQRSLSGKSFNRNFASSHTHDKEDFFDAEYFGEPWRNWKSSYFVWADARNYYFVFLTLVVIGKIRKYRKNISNKCRGEE